MTSKINLHDVICYLCKNYKRGHDLNLQLLKKIIFLADWYYFCLPGSKRLTSILWEKGCGPETDVFDRIISESDILEIELVDCNEPIKYVILSNPDIEFSLSGDEEAMLTKAMGESEQNYYGDFKRSVNDLDLVKGAKFGEEIHFLIPTGTPMQTNQVG